MEAKVSRIGRWMARIGMLVALLVGGLAGSVFMAKTGLAPLGVGNTIPLWFAASSPIQTGQISFANGFSAVAAKDIPAIVNIASTKIVRSPEGGQMSLFFFGPIFPTVLRGPVHPTATNASRREKAQSRLRRDGECQRICVDQQPCGGGRQRHQSDTW